MLTLKDSKGINHLVLKKVWTTRAEGSDAGTAPGNKVRQSELHRRRDHSRNSKTSSGGDSQLAGQVKVGKVKIRNCAFKHDDAKGLVCVHSREQILEALEHRAVHHVERWAIKNGPPVGGRFLDDPQW